MHRSNQNAVRCPDRLRPVTADKLVPILRPHLPTLLSTTALVTTLVLGLTHGQGIAQVVNIVASPTPVTHNNLLDCVSANDCIFISTINDGSFIDLTNSGDLTAGDDGIETITTGSGAFILIDNSGSIVAVDQGISATTGGSTGIGIAGGPGGAGAASTGLAGAAGCRRTR
jgi:hypothetical protein